MSVAPRIKIKASLKSTPVTSALVKVVMISEGSLMFKKTMNHDQVISEIKEFVEYSRGCENLQTGELQYRDYAHDGTLTVFGPTICLKEIQSMIKPSDWACYEK